MHQHEPQKQQQKDNSQHSHAGSADSQVSVSLAGTPLMQRKAQQQASVFGSADPPQSPATENKTGLPLPLKQGMENLTGINLDQVRVHRNSAKPATVKAHAYARGSDIHLASGQEHHLPHELGHVVQQMRGQVKPTTSVGGMAVNDNPGLEKEASLMGGIAQRGDIISHALQDRALTTHVAQFMPVVQRALYTEVLIGGNVIDEVIIVGRPDPTFGSKMGAHTAAFQLIKDSIRKDLKGKDLNTAVSRMGERVNSVIGFNDSIDGKWKERFETKREGYFKLKKYIDKGNVTKKILDDLIKLYLELHELLPGSVINTQLSNGGRNEADYAYYMRELQSLSDEEAKHVTNADEVIEAAIWGLFDVQSMPLDKKKFYEMTTSNGNYDLNNVYVEFVNLFSTAYPDALRRAEWDDAVTLNYVSNLHKMNYMKAVQIKGDSQPNEKLKGNKSQKKVPQNAQTKLKKAKSKNDDSSDNDDNNVLGSSGIIKNKIKKQVNKKKDSNLKSDQKVKKSAKKTKSLSTQELLVNAAFEIPKNYGNEGLKQTKFTISFEEDENGGMKNIQFFERPETAFGGGAQGSHVTAWMVMKDYFVQKLKEKSVDDSLNVLEIFMEHYLLPFKHFFGDDYITGDFIEELGKDEWENRYEDLKHLIQEKRNKDEKNTSDVKAILYDVIRLWSITPMTTINNGLANGNAENIWRDKFKNSKNQNNKIKFMSQLIDYNKMTDKDDNPNFTALKLALRRHYDIVSQAYPNKILKVDDYGLFEEGEILNEDVQSINDNKFKVNAFDKNNKFQNSTREKFVNQVIKKCLDIEYDKK